jgi:hypothetical protein
VRLALPLCQSTSGSAHRTLRTDTRSRSVSSDAITSCAEPSVASSTAAKAVHVNIVENSNGHWNQSTTRGTQFKSSHVISRTFEISHPYELVAPCDPPVHESNCYLPQLPANWHRCAHTNTTYEVLFRLFVAMASWLASRVCILSVCMATVATRSTSTTTDNGAAQLPHWVGPRPNPSVRGAGLKPLQPSHRVTVYNITLVDGSNNTNGL